MNSSNRQRRALSNDELVLSDGKSIAFDGHDLLIGDPKAYWVPPIRIEGQEAVRSLRCFLTMKCQEWDREAK